MSELLVFYISISSFAVSSQHFPILAYALPHILNGSDKIWWSNNPEPQHHTSRANLYLEQIMDAIFVVMMVLYRFLICIILKILPHWCFHLHNWPGPPIKKGPRPPIPHILHHTYWSVRVRKDYKSKGWKLDGIVYHSFSKEIYFYINFIISTSQTIWKWNIYSMMIFTPLSGEPGTNKSYYI